MSTWKKLKLWLGLTEGYKADAIDRDGDGIVQEGTPSERKVENAPRPKPPVKKSTTATGAKKPAAAKKPTASKKTK